MGEKEIKEKIIQSNKELDNMIREIEETEMLMKIKKIECKKLKNNIETLKLELEEINLTKQSKVKEKIKKEKMENKKEQMAQATLRKYQFADIKNPVLKEHLYNRYFSTEKETIAGFEDDMAYAQKYAQRHKEA